MIFWITNIKYSTETLRKVFARFPLLWHFTIMLKVSQNASNNYLHEMLNIECPKKKKKNGHLPHTQ